MTLSLLPLVNSFGIDNANLPKVQAIPEVSTSISFDNNTGNVNNSIYWGGYSWHNMSIPFFNWVGSFIYNYNQSSPYDIYNYNMSDGNTDLNTHADNVKEYWGDANDSSIYYNGSDVLFNPRDVGSGDIYIPDGDINFPLANQKLVFMNRSSIFNNGTNFNIRNNLGGGGDIIIENDVANRDIQIKVLDGSVDTTMMHFDGSTSYLGIGTTTPVQKVDIVSAGTTLIRVQGSDKTLNSPTAFYSSSPPPGFFLRNINNSANTLIGTGMYMGTGGGAVAAIGGIQEVANSLGALGLYTGGTGLGEGEVPERLRITSSGNVGINTITPSTKLEVNGTGKFSNNATFLERVRMAGNSTTANTLASQSRLLLTDDGLVPDNIGVLEVHADDGGPWLARFFNDVYSKTTSAVSYYSNTNGDFFMGTDGNKDFNFYSNGLSKVRMIIRGTTGFIGIGTGTDTISSRLTVNSSARGAYGFDYWDVTNIPIIQMYNANDGSGALYANDINEVHGVRINGNGSSYFAAQSAWVTIGTKAAPKFNLEVNGTTGLLGLVNITGNVTITNNVTIKSNLNISGSLNQVNGNATINMIYGSLYNFTDVGQAGGLTDSGVYYNLTISTAGELNGFKVWQSGALGTQLQAQVSGYYSVDGVLSADFAGGEYGVGIVTNGANPEVIGRCYTRTDITGTNGLPITCMKRLVAGDNITMVVDDESNPTKDISIKAINIKLLRVGN